jgi:hypothetical protein
MNYHFFHIIYQFTKNRLSVKHQIRLVSVIVSDEPVTSLVFPLFLKMLYSLHAHIEN